MLGQSTVLKVRVFQSVYWKLMSQKFLGIWTCHPLKDNGTATFKFSNKKGSLQILHVKEDFKYLDLAELDLPEHTKIL